LVRVRKSSDSSESGVISSDDSSELPRRLMQKRLSDLVDRSTLQVPVEGWSLSEVVENPLFNADTGMFTIPVTDRQLSFEECIFFRIINPESAYVIHPRRKKNLSLSQALKKKILSPTAHYCGTEPECNNIPLVLAITKGLVIPFSAPSEHVRDS